MKRNPEQTVYPLSAVRALALHAQSLGAPPSAEYAPDADDIYAAIDQVGWVQIDALQMVHRSQYLALWSRLGSYDTDEFDRLLFDDGSSRPEGNGRRLFEYWMHEACVIPLTHYRYRLPLMRLHRNGGAGWRRQWATQPENIKLMDSILERIRSDGPARPADFKDRKSRRGSWWNWTPSKIALEHLYNTGDLAIANRVNFQRVYDIPDRVLPDWVDRTEPTEEEAARHLLEKAMRAQGVCSPPQVGDYINMKRNTARPFIDQLLDDGVFVLLQANLADGKTHRLVVHRDNLPLLEKAADGALTSEHTTFLSPFDSLFWARGRDMQFWGFRQTLEAYKPEGQREWGYFCLPILYKDRLVGRFDPKLERKAKTLRLKKLYLEPGLSPGNELVYSVAIAMRDFMAFHDAKDLVIEHSAPEDFGHKLMEAL